MEEKDRPLISWKAISIILIILILAYAGYKGFTYGQTALENYIDAEADARAEEQLKDLKQELYRKTAYIDWAAKSGYMAGYYANKMGYDCPVSSEYFCSVYGSIKEWLPQENLDKISEVIEKQYSDEVLSFLGDYGLNAEHATTEEEFFQKYSGDGSSGSSTQPVTK